jgi:predicted amidohydrolase YtcJ
MVEIFLLVKILLYSTGAIYADEPWVFKEWDTCSNARDIMNKGRSQILASDPPGYPREPVRTFYVCVRHVKP